jgi:hypothetical protein
MKQLSMWLLGLAVFGGPLALAADPTLPPPPAPSATPNAGCCAPQVPCLGNCCDNCGCGCEHQGGLIGGVGFYLVQPYFSNNPAYNVSVINATAITGGSTGTPPPLLSTSRQDISHDMDIAPEIWLGYISDSGFGFRTRFWYFRQDTSQSLDVPTAAANTNTIPIITSAAPLGLQIFSTNIGSNAIFDATSKLDMQVWDLEALQDIRSGSWDLLLAGGLRLAHINQEYNAFASAGVGGATPVSESLTSSRSFTGAGPVVGLEARRYFGNSGLAFYSKACGALLFGSDKQNGIASTPGFAYAGIPPLSAVASDHRDRVMPVGEIEIGLEAGRNVGRSRLFGQIALVAQDWFGAGNASHSVSGAIEGFSIASSSADSDLGFLGLAFRLGINY